MKKSFGQHCIYNNKDLSWFDFGYDMVAEHQYGFNGIKKYFGIGVEKDTYGITHKKITKVPFMYLFIQNVFIQEEEYTVFIFNPYLDYKQFEYDKIPDTVLIMLDLMPIKNEDLVCSWSDNSFGIVGKTRCYGQDIRTIFESILKKECCIDVFPDMLLGETNEQIPSLHIGIVKNIPDETREFFREKDLGIKKRP